MKEINSLETNMHKYMERLVSLGGIILLIMLICHIGTSPILYFTLHRQRILSPPHVDGYFILASNYYEHIRFRYLISRKLCSLHQQSFN